MILERNLEEYLRETNQRILLENSIELDQRRVIRRGKEFHEGLKNLDVGYGQIDSLFSYFSENGISLFSSPISEFDEHWLAFGDLFMPKKSISVCDQDVYDNGLGEESFPVGAIQLYGHVNGYQATVHMGIGLNKGITNENIFVYGSIITPGEQKIYSRLWFFSEKMN